MLQHIWIEAVVYAWKHGVKQGMRVPSWYTASRLVLLLQEGPVAVKRQEDNRFSLRSKVVSAIEKRNESYKATRGTQPKQNTQRAQQLGSRGQGLGWFGGKVAHPCPHGSSNSAPISQH